MLTTKAGEILGNNAIHLSGLDIFHHALECWAIKVRTTPTIINVLVNYNEVLLISKLCDDFALGFNTNAFSVILIVSAQSHIERDAINQLFHRCLATSFSSETTRTYDKLTA